MAYGRMNSDVQQVAVEALRVTKASIDVLETVEQVSSAVEILLKIVESVEQARINKKDALRLIRIAEDFIKQISGVVKEGKIPESMWKPHLNALEETLRRIQELCNEIAPKSWLKRVVHEKAHKDMVQRYWVILSDAQAKFQSVTHVQIQGQLAVVHHRLAQGEEIDCGEFLQRLAPGINAQWTADAPTGCLKGTREDVIASVKEWLDYPIAGVAQRIFTITGPAGFGKSAIARSVCEMLSERNQLLASFFIASAEDRRNPSIVIQSIARQLAESLQTSLAEPVALAVKNQPEVFTMGLTEQVQALLLNPLMKIQWQRGPLVIVIDGIDDCDKHNDEDGNVLFKLLSEMVSLTQADIRLFVTSVRLPRDSPSLLQLNLLAIPTDDVFQDVCTFLDFQFDSLRGTHQELIAENTGPEWPVRSDIEKLANIIGHFFLYGVNLMRYIGSPSFYPPDRLEKLLGGADTGVDRDLDRLYLDALRLSVAEVPSNDLEEACRRKRIVIGGVVLLQGPLPVAAYANLIDVHASQTRNDIESISTVIHAPPDDFQSSVGMYHRSFSPFIMDPERCIDERFFISYSEQHSVLAERCLRVMSDMLHPNMRDIQDPSMPNSSIDELERAQWQTLRYACQHWATHLQESPFTSLSPSLYQSFVAFLEKMNSWVEVMSLLNLLDQAIHMLSDVISWCEEISEQRPSVRVPLEQMAMRLNYNQDVAVRALAIHESPLTPFVTFN